MHRGAVLAQARAAQYTLLCTCTKCTVCAAKLNVSVCWLAPNVQSMYMAKLSMRICWPEGLPNKVWHGLLVVCKCVGVFTEQ